MYQKELYFEDDTIFQLPIALLDNRYKLSSSLVDDLELTQLKDQSNCSIYKNLFASSTIYGDKLINKWGEYYTDDIDYLKQQQEIIKNLRYEKCQLTKMNERWNEIQQNTSFLSDFQYFHHEKLAFVNDYPMFLTTYSFINLLSPLTSLTVPFFLLLVPFFILKFIRQIPLTLSSYFSVLKTTFQNHALGSIFSLSSRQGPSKAYAVISIVMYVYSTYNNILSCIKYYKNFDYIHDTFDKLQNYLTISIRNINNFITTSKNIAKQYSSNKFNNFIENTENYSKNLIIYNDNIHTISPVFTFHKTMTNLGNLLHQFHQFRFNRDLKESFIYSFFFNSFLDNLNNIKLKLTYNVVNLTSYSDKDTCKITNVRYQNIPDSVSNSINLKDNYIITGPNASGKTTILKSTLLAVVYSQQIGVGYFESFKLKPYQYIHCYLNIPDTSGRDSLFQAEARRCKDILSTIDNQRHFCIFDELFSGTNPYEAVASAYSFLTFLKAKNINIMLTTHYIDLCKKFRKSKRFTNYHMDIVFDPSENIVYNYKLEKNISSIKGGIEVLKQLEFPQEIINNTKAIINKM